MPRKEDLEILALICMGLHIREALFTFTDGSSYGYREDTLCPNCGVCVSQDQMELTSIADHGHCQTCQARWRNGEWCFHCDLPDGEHEEDCISREDYPPPQVWIQQEMFPS